MFYLFFWMKWRCPSLPLRLTGYIKSSGDKNCATSKF